ncbi:MAG: hypothetical protein ATN35_01665 [Epulopiscium sp. Nele67-Bin004]|nr:MAG: hypothetical protein ATN35_01665 [Epulopiscium sp. Nele67-Bin004]
MKKNILEKWQNFLRKDCAGWYAITDVFKMLPRLAQGQTTPTEQLGRKRLDGKLMLAGRQ